MKVENQGPKLSYFGNKWGKKVWKINKNNMI